MYYDYGVVNDMGMDFCVEWRACGATMLRFLDAFVMFNESGIPRGCAAVTKAFVLFVGGCRGSPGSGDAERSVIRIGGSCGAGEGKMLA